MTHWNFIRFQHGWQATNLTSGKAWMLHDGDVLSFHKKGSKFMEIELSADGIAYLEVSEDIDRKDLAEALEGQKR